MTAQASLRPSLRTFQLVNLNLLAMIGIGPFLTLPSMLKHTGLPWIYGAWILGAMLSLCDGLVYSDLAEAFPSAGGPYLYLKKLYPRVGPILSFAFVFQTLLTGPLSFAGAARGCMAYILSGLNDHIVHGSTVGAGAALMMGIAWVVMQRPTAWIGKLGYALLMCIGVALIWLCAKAFAVPHHSTAAAIATPLSLPSLGMGALFAMYNYGGYTSACLMAEDSINFRASVRRAIVVSIVVIAFIYMLLTYAVLRTDVFSHPTTEHLTWALDLVGGAWPMRWLMMAAAWGSLLSLLVAYARIPFAAARDGVFFRYFEKLNAHDVPSRAGSLLCLASIPLCFLPLETLVRWLMAVQVLMVFLPVSLGALRFKFRLYTLVACALWLSVMLSCPALDLAVALVTATMAVVAYQAYKRRNVLIRPIHAEPESGSDLLGRDASLK